MANTTSDQGLLRIIKLHFLLKDQTGKTWYDLGKALGCDERTIHSYIHKLEATYNAKIRIEYKGKKAYLCYEDPSQENKIDELFQSEIESRINQTIKMLEGQANSPMLGYLRYYLICLQNKQDSKFSNLVFFEQNSYLTDDKNKDTFCTNFNAIFDALIQEQPLKIDYRSFHGKTNEYTVHPYCLKQYLNRWYLCGYTEGQMNPDMNGISTIPLEGILSVRTFSVPFQKLDIDMSTYFNEIIGTTVIPGNPVETIKLKVDKAEYRYIKTKKLHPSQEEVSEDADHVYVTLKVRRNSQLTGLLFSYMDAGIEVLEPLELREEIKNRLKKMAEMYK